MKYKAFQSLILISYAVYIKATKWLASSPDFNSQSAWDDEKMPCPGDEVIFPQDYDAILILPKEVDIAGFVLPHDGALLLNQNSMINIGGDGRGVQKPHHCNGESGKAYLNPSPIKKWFNPHSWRSTGGNTALPHMEMVPCNNDTVVLNTGSLAIDMENVPFLRLGELSLAGAAISRSYLQHLISNSDIGSIIFKNSATMTVEFYRNDVCGCHKSFEDFVEPICHNIVSSCNRPHCLTPVTPYGSCCPVCGAILRFATDACDDQKLQLLHNLIEKRVQEQRLTEDIDFYVNYINSHIFGNFLQAIIVDRNGYDKLSVEFVKALNASTDWADFFTSKVKSFEIQLAGRPYNPNITFGSILLILLCLIFVGLVALIIFTHYAPDHPYLHRLPQRWRNLILRSPFVFARFDNVTNADDGGAETHDGNMTIRYTECADATRQQAFDNPLFETTRESTDTATASPPLTTNFSDTTTDNSSIRLQSSADVKLNKSNTLVSALDDDEDKENLTEIKLETMAYKGTKDDEHEDCQEEIQII